MNQQFYLIFELGQSRYGIPTSVVQEIFFVPDITPVPETPVYVIGMINLRGEILPVINLHQRLGQKPFPYQTTDSVIVLQWQSQRVGVLVNQVCEIQPIATDQLQHASTNGRSAETNVSALTGGIASLDTGLIMLLNPEALVQSSSRLTVSSQALGYASQNENSQPYTNDGTAYSQTIVAQETVYPFAHLPLDAQQQLQERAENLRQPNNAQETGGIPVAVVGLGDEYLGLGLETVHEFTDIHKVTPVPCCPSHILGNMNLRGEIITLVDISQVINLPIGSLKTWCKAIIIRFNQLTAGIAVDDIFDLIYLDPTQISAVPIAICSGSDDFLQGVASYQDKMMSIINLSKILATDVLTVDEEV
ncbi:MAG: hypothetical protein Kow00121_40230 [Elainellaceae cyanobacterium]